MANSANTFAAASGHDQTVLRAFNPQPYSDGLVYPETIFTPSAVYDDGDPFVRLRFKAPSAQQVAAIYSQLGLTSAKYANVTISLPDVARTTWTDYNGVAIRPAVVTWDGLRYGTLDIVIRQLEAV